mgnify:CR=1 FL=1
MTRQERRKRRRQRRRRMQAGIAVLCGVSTGEALFMAPGEVFDLWELYLSAHGKNRGEEGV